MTRAIPGIKNFQISILQKTTKVIVVAYAIGALSKWVGNPRKASDLKLERVTKKDLYSALSRSEDVKVRKSIKKLIRNYTQVDAASRESVQRFYIKHPEYRP